MKSKKSTTEKSLDNLRDQSVSTDKVKGGNRIIIHKKGHVISTNRTVMNEQAREKPSGPLS